MHRLVNILLRLLKVIRKKDLYILRNVKIEREHAGNTGASWTIHPNILKHNSIIYSFGVGNDISWDLHMIEKFDASIYAYDPTPKSLEWLKTIHLPSNFKIFPFGLASYDGTATFNLPDNPDHVSASFTKTGKLKKTFDATVKKLKTILDENQHSHIHILKMDIEGAEYDVIDDLIHSNIRPDQILIEFHHRFAGIGIEKTKKAIRNLQMIGYAIFDVSDTGEEISFIRKDLC
jgi:FkbM family methyltransferase